MRQKSYVALGAEWEELSSFVNKQICASGNISPKSFFSFVIFAKPEVIVACLERFLQLGTRDLTCHGFLREHPIGRILQIRKFPPRPEFYLSSSFCNNFSWRDLAFIRTLQVVNGSYPADEIWQFLLALKTVRLLFL